jgi:hypothetical protein
MAPFPIVRVEHLVDGLIKEPRDPEGQRQRRQVAAVLDRDNRLPGHAQRSGQLGL